MKTKASTPENHRLYAVGDIHGRLDLLTRLLAMIEADAAAHGRKKKKLIFLGDYVDRGLDSKGVIDRLLGSFGEGVSPIFLRGNHDDCLLRFLEGDDSIVPLWLQFGGAATLASYGVNPYAPSAAPASERIKGLREQLRRAVPDAHRAFLNDTVHAVTYGDYYFVHAGVRPGVALASQTPEDQMWIRDAFLFYPKGMGKMIVHGHTIHSQPDIRPNRIGIDTGAYASGCLTCLVMDGTERTFFST